MIRCLCVVAMLAFLIASCKEKPKDDVDTTLIHNPGKAMTAEDSARMPIVAFDTLEHNFGEIKEGETAEYEFRFTNTGKGNLLITDVKASCGCTTPYWPKNIIKPGESEAIKVSYDSEGRPGSFRKGVTVTSNTYPNTTRLVISGVVKSKEE